MQLVAEPGEVLPLAVEDERAVLGTDIGAGEPLGEVVGVPAVVEEVAGPAIQAAVGRLRFELADFLERWDAAGECEREPSHDREVIGRGRGSQAARLPVLAERVIDGADGLLKVAGVGDRRIETDLAQPWYPVGTSWL